MWREQEGAIKALFVEHSSLNPPSPTPIPPYPPIQPLLSLPLRSLVDFSLNAIRNVTGPIHGQMEGLAVRLETNTFSGE